VTIEDLVRQDGQDIRALLATREGARFFARLLETCGVYRLSYEPGDTHATAFKEGQRNVGNMILAELTQCDNFGAALKAAMKEREIDECRMDY
jgi:hypothetical protein